jgi:Cu+-exporting ATPase
MSCASCVASVKTALSKLDGVFKVEVDLAERVARVQFVPEKVTPDLLVATIKGAGFDAGPAAHVN